MKPARSLRVFFAVVVAALLAGPVRAAPEAEAAAGRALLKRYADAIVGIELVVTLKMKSGDREMPPREQRIEVNGTVISASGLTVTSLAQVDPQAMFDAMRAQGGGRGAELVGIDFKEVKLRLADGKEIPARFVLKDADLDLAFMAPEKSADAAAPEFPGFVKLDDTVEGEVLTTYFSVERAPKFLQRVPLVRTSEIIGVVEKPRRFYLPTVTRIGAPFFNAKGQLLGVALQNYSGGGSSVVVLPASDIAEMAKQAAVAQLAPPPAPAVAPEPAAAPASPAAPAGN